MAEDKKAAEEELSAADSGDIAEEGASAEEKAEACGNLSADEGGSSVRAEFGVSSDGTADVRPRFGEDKYSFLWGLLSFFAPVVAFALRNLWRRSYPMRAKSMLIGSMLGIVFYIALFVTAIALIVTRVILSKRFM